MGELIRLRRRMTKDELIDHLNGAHALRNPIAGAAKRGYTMESLADMHRLIHLGIGASADHRHGR